MNTWTQFILNKSMMNIKNRELIRNHIFFLWFQYKSSHTWRFLPLKYEFYKIYLYYILQAIVGGNFSIFSVVCGEKIIFKLIFFGSLIVHGYLKDRKFLRSNVFVQFIFVIEVSKNVNFAELKISSYVSSLNDRSFQK